jgi:ABC-2 type transport system permease protein
MFFGWTLYPLVRATLSVTVFMIGGLAITGMSLSQADPLAPLVILALMVTILGSLGLISGAFAIVFKQSDPFTRMILVASGVLSGTVYPLDIFPGWLQGVARTLPQTHAIEAMRLAVLNGSSVSDLRAELALLALYAAVLLPAGIWIFQRGMHRARLDGSLAHY